VDKRVQVRKRWNGKQDRGPIEKSERHSWPNEAFGDRFTEYANARELLEKIESAYFHREGKPKKYYSNVESLVRWHSIVTSSEF
jgi:hypothetical protein